MSAGVENLDQRVKKLEEALEFYVDRYNDVKKVDKKLETLRATCGSDINKFYHESEAAYLNAALKYQQCALGIWPASKKEMAANQIWATARGGASISAGIIGGVLAPVTFGVTAIALPIVAFIALEVADIAVGCGQSAYANKKRNKAEKDIKMICASSGCNFNLISRSEIIMSLSPKIAYLITSIFRNQVVCIQQESINRLAKALVHQYMKTVLLGSQFATEDDVDEKLDSIFPQKDALKDKEVKMQDHEGLRQKHFTVDDLLKMPGVSTIENGVKRFYSCYPVMLYDIGKTAPIEKAKTKAHLLGYIFFENADSLKRYKAEKAAYLKATTHKDHDWIEDNPHFYFGKSSNDLVRDVVLNDQNYKLHRTQGGFASGLHALLAKQFYHDRWIYTEDDFLGVEARNSIIKNMKLKLKQRNNVAVKDLLKKHILEILLVYVTGSMRTLKQKVFLKNLKEYKNLKREIETCASSKTTEKTKGLVITQIFAKKDKASDKPYYIQLSNAFCSAYISPAYPIDKQEIGFAAQIVGKKVFLLNDKSKTIEEVGDSDGDPCYIFEHSNEHRYSKLVCLAPS